MAETTPLLDDERTTTAPQSSIPISLKVPTAHGVLRLSHAPASEPAHKAAPGVPAQMPPWTAGRRRHPAYIASRCYDVGVALLLLLSAAVAFYRLIWMGQP